MELLEAVQMVITSVDYFEIEEGVLTLGSTGFASGTYLLSTSDGPKRGNYKILEDVNNGYFLEFTPSISEKKYKVSSGLVPS